MKRLVSRALGMVVRLLYVAPLHEEYKKYKNNKEKVMKAEQKLWEVGSELPELLKPDGLCTPSRRVGNPIYIAGQMPDIHGVHQVVGVVGEGLTIGDDQRSTQICALNILSVLKAKPGDLDKVRQLVQTISYVRCAKGSRSQPQVVDGASRLLWNLHGGAGVAVRLAVGANELLEGSATEILVVVEAKES